MSRVFLGGGAVISINDLWDLRRVDQSTDPVVAGMGVAAQNQDTRVHDDWAPEWMRRQWVAPWDYLRGKALVHGEPPHWGLIPKETGLKASSFVLPLHGVTLYPFLPDR